MNVRTYENEPRYILETNYGCHSNYGWAYTCASEELEAAKMQIDQWRKIPGSYRLIDNMTNKVIM